MMSEQQEEIVYTLSNVIFYTTAHEDFRQKNTILHKTLSWGRQQFVH